MPKFIKCEQCGKEIEGALKLGSEGRAVFMGLVKCIQVNWFEHNVCLCSWECFVAYGMAQRLSV